MTLSNATGTFPLSQFPPTNQLPFPPFHVVSAISFGDARPATRNPATAVIQLNRAREKRQPRPGPPAVIERKQEVRHREPGLSEQTEPNSVCVIPLTRTVPATEFQKTLLKRGDGLNQRYNVEAL